MSITLMVNSLSVWRVASVSNRAETEPICFHDVEFGAPEATYLIGVTVPKGFIRVVYCWHKNLVDCSDASTAYLAQIDIVLDAPTEHVWGEVSAFVNLPLCG